MKEIIQKLLNPIFKGKTTKKKTANFYDYPAAQRIQILRTAEKYGRKEQTDLIKKYQARFGSI